MVSKIRISGNENLENESRDKQKSVLISEEIGIVAKGGSKVAAFRSSGYRAKALETVRIHFRIELQAREYNENRVRMQKHRSRRKKLRRKETRKNALDLFFYDVEIFHQPIVIPVSLLFLKNKIFEKRICNEARCFDRIFCIPDWTKIKSNRLFFLFSSKVPFLE